MALRISDIYGYIFLVPVPHFPMPLGRMTGSDEEYQIGLYEGEQLAVVRTAEFSGCLRPQAGAAGQFFLR